MSLVVSGIICVVWTLICPAKEPWSWKNFKAIEIEDDENVRGLCLITLQCRRGLKCSGHRLCAAQAQASLSG